MDYEKKMLRLIEELKAAVDQQKKRNKELEEKRKQELKQLLLDMTRRLN